MFKIITLFCIILLSSILVVAQPERTIEVSMPIVPAMRELHHDYINNNQKLTITSLKDPNLLFDPDYSDHVRAGSTQ